MSQHNIPEGPAYETISTLNRCIGDSLPTQRSTTAALATSK